MENSLCIINVSAEEEFTGNPADGALQLSHCGYLRCSPTHSFGPAIRNHLLIHYVVSGKGSYHRGGHAYPVAAGQVFIILPQELTYYEADSDDPWEYYWVGIWGGSIDEILSQLGVNREHLVLTLPASASAVTRCLSSMVESYTARHANTFRTLGYMNLFLAEIAAAFPPASDSNNLLVDKAARYIQENYADNLSVEELCRRFNVSRSHFSRLFKARAGVSPQQFIIRTRVESAKQLLGNTNLSVTDIAFSCGFQDTTHFAHVFKTYTSLSPSGYRLGRPL